MPPWRQRARPSPPEAVGSPRDSARLAGRRAGPPPQRARLVRPSLRLPMVAVPAARLPGAVARKGHERNPLRRAVPARRAAAARDAGTEAAQPPSPGLRSWRGWCPPLGPRDRRPARHTDHPVWESLSRRPPPMRRARNLAPDRGPAPRRRGQDPAPAWAQLYRRGTGKRVSLVPSGRKRNSLASACLRFAGIRATRYSAVLLRVRVRHV